MAETSELIERLTLERDEARVVLAELVEVARVRFQEIHISVMCSAVGDEGWDGLCVVCQVIARAEALGRRSE